MLLDFDNRITSGAKKGKNPIELCQATEVEASPAAWIKKKPQKEMRIKCLFSVAKVQ